MERAPVSEAPRAPADGPPLTAFRADPGAQAVRPVWIAQHDAMDCGAACLAMVAHAHGRRIGTATYRSLVHVTRDGASMWSLRQAARSTGFEATGVRLGLRRLQQMRLPAVVLMKYHFVVLFEADEEHVLIGDPAVGLVRMERAAFLADWSGTALLLRPTPALFTHPETRRAFLKYGALLAGSGRVLCEATLASTLALAFSLALPVLTQLLFDRVILRGHASELEVLVGAMVAVGLALVGASTVKTYLLGHAATRFGVVFSTQFYRTALSLPLNFFAVRRTGDVLSRFSEIDRIRTLLTRDVLSALVDALSIVFYLALLSVYRAELGGVATVGLAALVAASIALSKRVREAHRSVFVRRTGLLNRVVDILRGRTTVKSLDAELAARWRIESEYRGQIDAQLDLVLRRLLLSAVASGTTPLLTTAVFGWAAHLAATGALSVGEAIACGQIAALAFLPVRRLVALWSELQGVGVAFGRIEDVITSPRRPVLRQGAAPVAGEHGGSSGGRLEVRDLWFQYGSDASPWALRGVDLEVADGETVALVGRSGSGKSTLAHLLAFLHAPTRGEIRVEDRPVGDWDAAELRRRVGVVLQDTHLFRGTVLDNITYGQEHPDAARAEAAARAADADEFIRRLPEGYATPLGEEGEGLSGGERQRLCIARCFYREPSIVILDEATSSLDAESEAAVVEGMRRFCRGRTAIVIAHRLSTVIRADRVVVLDEGRVVEEGPHAELLARGGLYARLFAEQLES